MALPITPNTTCDVYHDPNTGPPSTPDLTGVRIHLQGDYHRFLETSEGETDWRFTHVALAEKDLDVRDRYHLGALDSALADTLWVPDSTGTAYAVVFVERVARGTALDHKRVYLLRAIPPWPNDNFV